jgi:hypothetical protein
MLWGGAFVDEAGWNGGGWLFAVVETWLWDVGRRWRWWMWTNRRSWCRSWMDT